MYLNNVYRGVKVDTTIPCSVYTHFEPGPGHWLKLPVVSLQGNPGILDQWYSTFFVHVPPDIISLQLCPPRVVGV
jgi:hypothetical protein